jgi:predicted HTH domain antitoxin
MKTVPLSTRVSTEEAREVDELARRQGLDRSSFLKQVIRRGLAEVRLEEACRAYRQRRATLAKAAEIAGLTVRDLLLRMALELNYTVDDLEQDIRAEP